MSWLRSTLSASKAAGELVILLSHVLIHPAVSTWSPLDEPTDSSHVNLDHLALTAGEQGLLLHDYREVGSYFRENWARTV
jgi:hypothetical protein